MTWEPDHSVQDLKQTRNIPIYNQSETGASFSTKLNTIVNGIMKDKKSSIKNSTVIGGIPINYSIVDSSVKDQSKIITSRP